MILSQEMTPIGGIAAQIVARAAARRAGRQIITTPGVYPDVPIDDYHGNPFVCDGPSISASGLKMLIDRPSLYWAYSVLNPRRFEKPSAPHFSFGQAAHFLILEGSDGFDQRFAVRPDEAPDGRAWNGNNASCKQWLADREREGRAVLTSEDMKAICYIADSLSRHPIVQGGILEGRTEMTMAAKFGPAWLRARPDKIPAHSGDFADLKTVASVRFDDLEKSIYKFGWHIQAAVVRKVARSIYGPDYRFGGFAFVFCEKTPPYDVVIMQIDDASIDLGEQQVNQGLELFAECTRRGEWPGEEGFSRTVLSVGLPAWARSRIETEIQIRKQEMAA